VIAVLIPVLNRPQNAQRVVSSIRQNSTMVEKIVFLCSKGDLLEVDACWLTGADVTTVPWEAGPGDWARKINWGFKRTKEPYVLLGADDLSFHPGWDVAALRIAKQSHCGLIGTNDLGNGLVMRGGHSTHPLISREYGEQGTIDEPDKILHEGYAHQWVDNELIDTARVRGQWAFAKDSIVEHLHPFWHKGEMDDTYRKALSTPAQDHALYLRRKRLWREYARV